MAYFVGILDGQKSVWGVRVPDLPGVYGGGASPEEAIADAISAARVWAAHQRAAGYALPKPRSVRAVLADAESAFDAVGGESAVMIPLIVETGVTVKANVSLDAGQLAAIDAEAERRGLTRSAFMASAALEKIEGR
jgi:predicted RNase H-like HicB family nuclease